MYIISYCYIYDIYLIATGTALFVSQPSRTSTFSTRTPRRMVRLQLPRRLLAPRVPEDEHREHREHEGDAEERTRCTFLLPAMLMKQNVVTGEK